MRKPFVLALFLFSGCMANQGLSTGTAAQVNIYRLSEICLGMSEEQVFQIMRYPTRNEQIDLQEGCYDIWFYITRSTVLDQRELKPHNLTPLIFKDGVLVGKGYDYYNHLLKKQAEEEETNCSLSMSSKPSKPQQPPSQPDEDDSEEETQYSRTEEDDRMIEQEQEQNFDYW